MRGGAGLGGPFPDSRELVFVFLGEAIFNRFRLSLEKGKEAASPGKFTAEIPPRVGFWGGVFFVD